MVYPLVVLLVNMYVALGFTLEEIAYLSEQIALIIVVPKKQNDEAYQHTTKVGIVCHAIVASGHKQLDNGKIGRAHV